MTPDLELQVVQWAEEKGIFDKSSPIEQLLKTLEEVREVEKAVRLGDVEDIQLEIGDVLVTMVVQAEFHGLSATRCLEAAYNKIKNRKGKMVDGFFVKEE